MEVVGSYNKNNNDNNNSNSSSKNNKICTLLGYFIFSLTIVFVTFLLLTNFSLNTFINTVVTLWLMFYDRPLHLLFNGHYI